MLYPDNLSVSDRHCFDLIQECRTSKLEKAVNYAQNHRDSLCTYLNDGRAELSNNAAERMAKANKRLGMLDAVLFIGYSN